MPPRSTLASADKKPKDTGYAAFRRDLLTAWKRLTQRTSLRHIRFVLLVVLIGAVLRIVRMNSPITYDEALAYTNYSARSLVTVFSDYTFAGNHVLHSFLVKVSTSVFGLHLWSLRLPALLAGILVMPLFYLFARAMFNRYIALMAVALVAASGPLIEYSALARGYSLVWLFMLSALLAGRHFVKEENAVSLTLMAVFSALGMWAVPTMLYGALMVYVWTFFYLVSMYRTTTRRRSAKLFASLLLFLALSFLLYLPVITAHSLEHVMHHPSTGGNTWKVFVNDQQDQAFELWGYFNDSSTTLISILGVIGIVYAAYVSTKYRFILLALVIGTVPLVIAQRIVAPPRVWTFVLFVLHLGSAIALFYVMKAVQDRLYAGFTKRKRTAWAALLLMAVMGTLAVRATDTGPERFPDARRAVDWAAAHARPGDRLVLKYPWDAPIQFHLMERKLDVRMASVGPAQGGRLFAMVGPGDGQTMYTVLMSNNFKDTTSYHLQKVQDWKRLEIFAPR